MYLPKVINYISWGIWAFSIFESNYRTSLAKHSLAHSYPISVILFLLVMPFLSLTSVFYASCISEERNSFLQVKPEHI